MTKALRTMFIRTAFTCVATAALGAGLAGCSGALAHTGSGDSRGDAASSTMSAASNPVSTPDPSTTPKTPTAASTTAPAAPASSAPNVKSSSTNECSGTVLTGALASGSGGAAGSDLANVVLTNRSGTTCTLQGWPGVSFVGHGNGTQIGAAAQQNRQASHPTVTLPSGASAVVPIKIAQAANYPTASCSPVTADGFRVYPPGSKTALFVKASGLTACTNTKAQLLTVSAVLPRS